MEKVICNNYVEIIAGTNNVTSKVYKEAAKSIDDNGPKSLAYLKNFITSIENVSTIDEVNDGRLTESRGNIKDFRGYEDIMTVMDFVKKNLNGMDITRDLVTIFDGLNKFQPQYSEAYNVNTRLIILEYECALHMLITGLNLAMCTNIDVVSTGSRIVIKKKNKSTYGTIKQTLHDLAIQLSNNGHGEYLDELNRRNGSSRHIDTNIEESTVYTEAMISATIDLIDDIFRNVGRVVGFGKNVLRTVKNSLFGIVPLIKSILYLRYKKKADMVLSLEQQAQYIQRNIEQLQNTTTMDPAKKAEIIQRQQAYIEAYRKKAEKLRAQLTEGEKEAAAAITDDNSTMGNVDNSSSVPSDDDFVLESSKTRDFF